MRCIILQVGRTPRNPSSASRTRHVGAADSQRKALGACPAPQTASHLHDELAH